MGTINLLKNGYQGKLGETVGQKWKNQMTVRTYQPTNNSKSEAQLDQRAHYKELITDASRLYSLAWGWPKNAVKNMNSFNLFTSVLEQFNNTVDKRAPLKPISIFSKQGIWGSVAQNSMMGYGLIIYQSPILNEENIKKVRAVAFFGEAGDNPINKYQNEGQAGSLQPIIIPEGEAGVRPGKAWLFTEKSHYTFTLNPYYALKIPYKGKIYYTTLCPNVNSFDNQWEFQMTYDGDELPLYFN